MRIHKNINFYYILVPCLFTAHVAGGTCADIPSFMFTCDISQWCNSDEECMKFGSNKRCCTNPCGFKSCVTDIVQNQAGIVIAVITGLCDTLCCLTWNTSIYYIHIYMHVHTHTIYTYACPTSTYFITYVQTCIHTCTHMYTRAFTCTVYSQQLPPPLDRQECPFFSSLLCAEKPPCFNDYQCSQNQPPPNVVQPPPPNNFEPGQQAVDKCCPSDCGRLVCTKVTNVPFNIPSQAVPCPPVSRVRCFPWFCGVDEQCTDGEICCRSSCGIGLCTPPTSML